MITFIHAADFHLDSAFGALSNQQAAARRRESRELTFRLADYVNKHNIRLVLLAGDLFDSGNAFRETGEQLSKALGQMNAEVFIAPGNHDWYGPSSPWQTVGWPENVHIFTESVMSAWNIQEWGIAVHGAAFTAPERQDSPLTGFTAPKDGLLHLAVLHGELEPPEARYGPIRRREISGSGLAYLALGHIHKRTEPFTIGGTLCAWPGCMEGRGFDELGEKGFYQGVLKEDGQISLTFVPFARRRYEILEVDVTGQDPRTAVELSLPDNTAEDLYRILLTGETGESGAGAAALQEALAERFGALEIRDHTRIAEDVWARSGEDSLRGLFLRELRRKWEAASTEEEQEIVTMAARFGLMALDHREL